MRPVIIYIYVYMHKTPIQNITSARRQNLYTISAISLLPTDVIYDSNHFEQIENEFTGRPDVAKPLWGPNAPITKME